MANQTPPNEADVERIMDQVLNALVDGAADIDVPPDVVDRLRQGAIPIIRDNYSGWLDDDNRAKALGKTRDIGASAARVTRARGDSVLSVADFDQGVVDALRVGPNPTPWCRDFMAYLGLQISGAGGA